MRDILNTNIIIHRGKVNKNMVENTLPAFMKCVDLGYAIELDIRLLKYKTIVVFHDANLKRLTGISEDIKDCTYEELKKFKIKNKYKIVTLKSVLNLVNGKVPILIDIKGNKENYILEEELLKILSTYSGEVLIQSFQVRSLNWLWKKQRKYAYGLIILNYFQLKLLTKLWINFRYDFISCQMSSIKDKNIKKLRKYKKIFGWTIKNNEDIQKYSSFCDKFICENIQ